MGSSNSTSNSNVSNFTYNSVNCCTNIDIQNCMKATTTNNNQCVVDANNTYLNTISNTDGNVNVKKKIEQSICLLKQM